MTIWRPRILEGQGPRYRAIADALQQDIEAGELPPGTRLPTHRALAETLGVTVGTVSRAYSEAEQRGLLESTVGRGTFTLAAPSVSAFVHNDDDGPIDLSINRPVVHAYVDDVAKSLARMSQRVDLAQCTVYQPRGNHEHRDRAAQWLREVEGFDARPERTLITSGAQHGLFVALAALTKPGDSIAVEALTYGGIKAVANQQHTPLIGLESDDEGVLPDSFERACVDNGVRVLVCQPNLQNPTCVSMSLKRRQALAETARRFDAWIVEDSVYGFLLREKPPAFVELAPERSVHINSVSKSMVPGLRVGFLHAPIKLREAISAAIRATVWMTAPLLMELVSQWIANGTGLKLANHQREEARARQALLQEVLGDQDLRTHPSAFHSWLSLPEPWRADDFCRACEARGVLVTPGSVFSTSREQNPTFVRLCTGSPCSRERLAQALGIVDALLQTQPGPSMDLL